MFKVTVLSCLLLTLGSAQWLERQVVLGDTFGGIGYPGELVVNPISGNVYIRSNPIQVFNPATMEKMRGPGVSGSVVFCPPSSKGYVVRDSLVIIDAAADTVIGATAPPFATRAYAYSRTSNRLYLASTDDTSLMVFDPDADSVVKTLGIGAVEALLWDSVWNRLYIATWTETAPWCPLKVLDCSTDTLMPYVQVGFELWERLVLSTVSHKLYCTGADTNGRGALVVVSTDSLKPIGTVPGLPDRDIMGYNPVTDRLYVQDDSFYVIDCRGDTILRMRELDVDVSALAVSSLTGNVYLGNDDSPQVIVMDTTDSVIGTIDLPGKATVWNDALTFSADRNQLYGATGWDGVAFAADASSDTLAGSVSYRRCGISQMVHNPAGNKLYLICPATDEVLVCDTTFGTPKRIPCGMTSAQGVLNQILDRLYVATGYRLRVIDCNSDSLIASKVMYGIAHPIPVMVPDLNKLYVFSADARDSVYVYDGLRDQVSSICYMNDPVTGAVYDPRSNRVFFSCGPQPTIRALDPVTDSVVKTFDLVSTSYHGRMAVNVDLGRLYYTDQLPTRLFTIDVIADSVIGSDSLPWGVEALFLNRRLGRLFMCGTDPARTLVYDCNQRAVVDTIDASFTGAGLMNDRNDKLYLRSGAVVDCRNDSVVAVLPPELDPRSMAWDAIDNRVFQATTSRLSVYRDDLTGVADRPTAARERRLPTIVRGVLSLPLASGGTRGASSVLLDITGRKVLDLKPGRNEVRALPAGVYFVRQAVSRQTTKVVIQR